MPLTHPSLSPSPLSSSLHLPCCSAHLEEVPKTPVAHHLKESVMVHILPHVIKVVVFAPCTNTLLRIDNTLQLPKIAIGVHCALEDWLELHKCEHRNEASILGRGRAQP